MASAKLITPQNKPAYYKLTANIMVDGKPERRYSRFDFDPKALRTAKSRTSAATAAAVLFEKEAQAEADIQQRGGNKSFEEVAKEHIQDSKARLEPSARLRGAFDDRKNKANTTKHKENYLSRIVLVCPWFSEKSVSQINKADYTRVLDELDVAGVTRRESAVLREEARSYKKASFRILTEKVDVTAYTMAEAFRGKSVTRHSAEEIAKALGVPLEAAFEIRAVEKPLTRKTLREYALFIRQVLQYAADHYGTAHPDFSLPAKGARPRCIDCLHEDEVQALFQVLPTFSMPVQAMILTLINSGVRRGELAGLTWQDLDFSRCTIHVYKSLLVLNDYGYQLTTTKESNDRYVDVAPEFMEFMKKYLEYWKLRRQMMGASWQTTLDPHKSKYETSLRALAGNDFVICDDYGWPLNPGSYARTVKLAGMRAGIRHLHPHMFRHTFVSILMANSDIDIATVAAEAGHAQPSTTLMIYTQQYKKRRQAIRSQLSRELYRK